MPFYEYQCAQCEHHLEVMQRISDAPLRKCPSCGKNGLKKLISAPVFRLKGSGWYETDFKSDKDNKRNLHGESDPGAKSEGKGDSKPSEKADAKSDTKSDAKPEAKAEAKSAASAVKSATRSKAKASPAKAKASKAKPAKAAKKGRR